ncbi:hypothetical protein [Nocardioides sp. R-C-SC26]|uniref:hypothetical protein n=1 Tax=Nocardioides sp. R-C-SC26 TaxID=2870414 RepID=UPI001E4A1922|nr:hypothetical protein [Nocardioides sp. R-C-SC26]
MTANISVTVTPSDDLDRRREQRAALRVRHSQNLLRLMDERADLHGVLPLADFVDESIRWTA